MNRFGLAGVVFTVVAGALGAQEAKKPPYEFVSDFSLAASQGNQEVTTVSLGQRYTYAFPNWKFSQTARPTACAIPSCIRGRCVSIGC
jgi:hypothetical protein